MIRRLIAFAAVASTVVAASTGVAAASHRHDGLAALRRATAAYHSLAAAKQAGYGLFTDAAGIACIDMAGMGAMGVHYVNGDLVGDVNEDPLRPEALVYAPDDDGELDLAAVEYVVLQKPWDDAHSAPPALFGHTFSLTGSPNRYGLDPFYSLHVWAWERNPAGTFAPWNPNVSCTPSDHVDHDADSTGHR